MNIVLTGFMGTGKTTVGRRLAEDLRVPLLDVDASIEKEAGRSIRDIFEKEGEAHFRSLESQAIVRLCQNDRVVISTGGGALLYPENRDVLKKNGFIVCLSARAGTVLERLMDDMTRPLLAGENPALRIERLMKERDWVYTLCDLQIHTDDRTIADVAKAIIDGVGTRWGSHDA
jgi:shikimate kinase